MPVHKIPGGYQYGSTGKKYYGPNAKEKADKQALAIRLSGYKEPSDNRSPKEDTIAIGKEAVRKILRKDTSHG